MRNINPYSVIALPVQMLFGETLLASATAFVWKTVERQFLITNWHVMTGKHPETGKRLSAHGGEPDHIRVFFTAADNLSNKIGMVRQIVDPYGRPNWLVHPDYGRKVDVVALPFDVPPTVQLHPMNEQKQEPVDYTVGADVFVIGYPLGLRDGFPIWKRASMASEPELRTGSDPFLIDTATRPGMSGSPVICRVESYRNSETRVRLLGATGTKFVGVYSGRAAAADALDAQLGMVWPQAFLEEIVAGGKLDDPDFYVPAEIPRLSI